MKVVVTSIQLIESSYEHIHVKDLLEFAACESLETRTRQGVLEHYISQRKNKE